MDRLLLIDKPAGITSHDVVDRVRKYFHTKRVGHAGTLDPFATGLLIVGIDAATKELGGLSGLPKTYEAMARLGATSSTFDLDGEISEQPIDPDSRPTREEIERALDAFRGGYEQKAPIYSAKKIKGRKLYQLARQGRAAEEDRPSKHVEITALEILDYAWPALSFRVACGSGTYVRSLGDDIGRALGCGTVGRDRRACGAYLTTLRRTKIGVFSVENAVTLDRLGGS